MTRLNSNEFDRNHPHSQTKTAVLLMAHGSRHAAANDDLFYFADQLRARGRYPIVEASFLELAEPTIEEAGIRCVEQGAERVLMVPYFLSAGVHGRSDVTEIRQKLAARFPNISFKLGEPLGRHPLLLDIIEERAAEIE